ncbi:MAG: orc1/cdc6 family replication initiation protein [Aigarchaeota archaeon]|nr:orc1/cdc6 family replication initiation protein [Aigarchaeota archaeon]MCX8192362.1 orc1/cdc6 family replication initiation protein [Nitrososphaeria archaeon]MDW7986969.1 orc1/cdc6 family replication initiation protein [Nitrososphaerota archaeon]
MKDDNNVFNKVEGLHLQLKKRGADDPLLEVVERALQRPRIFKDRLVMRSDYIPDSLPHRAEHIRRLGEMLSPSLKLSRASNIFIYGKTGTGKTAVVKYVFNRFKEIAELQGLPLLFSYINCRISGTEYRVLAELCDAIGVKVPFTGLSKAEVFNRFRSALKEKSIILISCLDEIDVLVKNYGDNLLYELTRVNENFEGGGLNIVGVSNDLHFKELLDPRVLSSLSEEELVFHPYTALELVDILLERAAKAFYSGTVPEEVIRLCAAIAAQEHGDARRAIDLLRVAAEICERSGGSVVEEKHVRLAQNMIEKGRVFEALSTLPLHSKIVLTSLYLLVKNDILNSFSGTVYEVYREVCSLLGVEALSSRRVSTLISELDMLGVLSSEIVNMGRYGRTRRITLLTPVDEVEQVIKSDDLLKTLLDHKVNFLKLENFKKYNEKT